MTDTYMLCSTPRTGSTLLCAYLASTDVAGHPQSYFRAQNMSTWAEEWGLPCADGAYSYAAYLEAMRKAGSTANGVLGLRIMWGTLDEVIEQLARLYPHHADCALALLEQAFGRIGFIYLWRDDMLSQAISLYRAEQTDYWHSTEGPKPANVPQYDFDEIQKRVELLDQHNQAWQAWFREVGVDPLPVRYEDIDVDPERCTREILQFLDIELPINAQLNAPNQRLADSTTYTWKERFRTHLADERMKTVN